MARARIGPSGLNKKRKKAAGAGPGDGRLEGPSRQEPARSDARGLGGHAVAFPHLDTGNRGL
jgi:hypothetical protein